MLQCLLLLYFFLRMWNTFKLTGVADSSIM